MELLRNARDMKKSSQILALWNDSRRPLLRALVLEPAHRRKVDKRGHSAFGQPRACPSDRMLDGLIRESVARDPTSFDQTCCS